MSGADCDSRGHSAPKLGSEDTASVHREGRGRDLAERGQFASQACRTVYFEFALSNFSPVRSAVSNAEAHIPTQPSSPFQDARVSFSHEDQERTRGDFPPSRQGTQTRRRETGLPRVITRFFVCVPPHFQHKAVWTMRSRNPVPLTAGMDWVWIGDMCRL